jgi:hypothetical protein
VSTGGFKGVRESLPKLIVGAVVYLISDIQTCSTNNNQVPGSSKTKLLLICALLYSPAILVNVFQPVTLSCSASAGQGAVFGMYRERIRVHVSLWHG